MIKLRQWKNIIKKSGLFDLKYYLFTYPDIRLNHLEPIKHYIEFGTNESRNPSNEFNTSFYLEHYDDVRDSGINPLVHYILSGKEEGRFKNNNELSIQIIKDSDLFDENYYLSVYPDIAEADIEPIEHFVKYGSSEGRNPSKEFETIFYLEAYEDLRNSDVNPLVHYILQGKCEGRKCLRPLSTPIEKIDVNYFEELFHGNNNPSSEYIEFKKYKPINTDLKLIAFYLPQFHPIPQNDKAWGKGFTEWTNVSKALPQYKGHYQPRLPGELGFYDLRLIDIQKRQIELAKNYGLHGFCYHYYWFDAKKILDRPLQQVLDHPELDFPFCINWANENWTKRWDGLDQDIILKQKHTPEDDIAFLDAIKPILCDKRYIRVNGKPLLMIYRPQLFPEINATVKRWRKHAHKIGIGELYLVLTHSVGSQDPREIGFDAATEFPPNNFNAENITKNIKKYNPNFQGIIYNFDSVIRHSNEYIELDYVKFRGITPSWDNEARKPGKGSIFINATPKKFGDWLERLLNYTHLYRKKSEKIIFINAWNEWAEGAYLEPDRRLGYAYLQATRNALEQEIKMKNKRRIVLVIHDAHPHGAQYLILNMAKVFRESMDFIVEMIVLGQGSLMHEYRKYANVHELFGYDIQNKETIELVQKLYKQGASSAITNTTATGLIVPILKQCGFTVVCLVHELPQLIKDYQLQEHVNAIVNEADKIIFAATAVENDFKSLAKLEQSKVVIRPQGLYKKNPLQTDKQIQIARSELRQRFNLTDEARIILGVGFADYRKGIDIFVESGINLFKKDKNIYFLWLGHFEAQIEREIKQKIQNSGLNNHFIFPGLDYNSDIYYAGCDIFALTSREDPFPSVVLEALDASIPVVAFKKSGGSTELLSRVGGILVDEINSEGFSSALIELIDNPDRINRLGNAGKKIIDAEFSFRKYLFDLAFLANTGLQRVSVVVPNYNYEQYIKDRIGSIINQSYPIYEIIILDDASSDNSISIIKEIIQDQVIDCNLIINTNNSGNVFKQWAKGVKIASGDYIWIAEADDFSDPEFLNEVLKGFDDKNVVLSYCESKQMDSQGNILCNNYEDYVSDISSNKWTHNYTESGIDEIKNSLAIKNTIPNVSAVIFKHDILHSVLLNYLDEIKSYHVAGDWLTYIYVLKKGKITFFPNSLNHHRRHSSSMTLNSFDIAQLKEIMQIQQKIKNEFSPSEDVLCKSNSYADFLYKEFGLLSESGLKLADNPNLKKNL